MNRLFGKRRNPSVDRRPALLSMAALMILLLPTLIMITSTQKTTALPLAVSGNALDIPPISNGLISSLEVTALESGYQLKAHIKKSDVLAGNSDVEEKNWTLENEQELQDKLRALKNQDTQRTRIRLKPHSSSKTQAVVHVLDLLKSDKSGELFPETLLISDN